MESQPIDKQLFLSFEVCLDSDPITKLRGTEDQEEDMYHTYLATFFYKAELDNELIIMTRDTN